MTKYIAGMQGPGADCLHEIVEVIKRYDSVLYRDDAKDLLSHMAMIFSGQEEKQAALLLHEAGMDVVFSHGLVSGMGEKP